MDKVLNVAKLVLYITVILFPAVAGMGIFQFVNVFRQIPRSAFDPSTPPRVVDMDGGVTCYVQANAISCVKR